MNDNKKAIETIEDIIPYLKGDPNEDAYVTALSALYQIEQIKKYFSAEICQESFYEYNTCWSGLKKDVAKILEYNWLKRFEKPIDSIMPQIDNKPSVGR